LKFGLQPGQFPFESHFLSVLGFNLHYVDEGAGPVVLMLHGNPAWSFLYRRHIAALRGRYRCIAFDLAGFGLSEAPEGFSFLPKDHCTLISAALEALDIREATLVAHDWGGPIGIGAMLATRRIGKLVLGNTWAWPVNGDLHFEWFSKLMGGPIGRLGSERFALFVNAVMPNSMKRRKLTADEMRAYRAPFSGRSRKPMHIFPREITASGRWLATLETGLAGFKGPSSFIWPENDIAFREKELQHWRRLLPQASVTRIPRCGHFLWEDAREETLAALEKAIDG
jgi:haloalkane dehalogenase